MFWNALRPKSAEVSFLWERTRYGLCEKPTDFVAELYCHQKTEYQSVLLAVQSQNGQALDEYSFLESSLSSREYLAKRKAPQAHVAPG